MGLLEHTPAFDVESATALVEEYFAIRGSAQPLPSERDQNFLLTDRAGERFVLKVANALELPELLEAQNAVLSHLEHRVSFCPRLVPATSGDQITTIVSANGATYLARVVRYLLGVPLATIKFHSPELLHDLGRKLGQLTRALADFDHPAVHRDFHWDLANGPRMLHVTLDTDLTNLPRSVIHGDANDYNVLVNPDRNVVAGLIDFGDIVYSYTVGDLAIAIAYVVLGKADPRAAAAHVIAGYQQEFELSKDELDALWPLVRLRLRMSVHIAEQQQQQRPENEYLGISQSLIL